MRGLALVLIAAILLSYASFAQQSQCDYKVEILVEGEEFEPQDFTWRMRATKIEGKPTNITGTAEIKSNGKTIKSYKPWTSDAIAKQKTSSKYTPNLKPGSYEIVAEISVDCDDIDNSNNKDTKKIKIKGDAEEPKKSKDENAKAAAVESENPVDNEIANEETAKQSTSTIKPKSKGTAANEETDNIIQLNKNNQKNPQPKTTTYVINKPVVYESSNEKAKNLVMIFLLTLSILLNIVLIWRR